MTASEVTGNLITTKEAAKKWGISQRRVIFLCNEGRIDGASRVGNSWLISNKTDKPNDARIRDEKEKDGDARPFLKWAGGKKQLLPEISKELPTPGSSIKKYVEPFVGGGAVLFYILNNYIVEEAYINDINPELINSYDVIKNQLSELICMLSEYEEKYLKGDEQERRSMFLCARSCFNDLKKNDILNENKVKRAALMLFLNRTCFNGLYRENRNGEFNVPAGRYKNPVICDVDNLRKVSERLKVVNMHCGDYRSLDENVDADTIIYFDPPYRPLNATSSFNAYTKDAFDDRSQKELARYFGIVTKRGARAILSNSDPKNSNPNDNFFDELYAGYQIRRIGASRMINSNGSSRGKITELLITN